MQALNGFLNWLYYGVLAPFFSFLADILTLLILHPMDFLRVPVWLQVVVVSFLTVVFALFLRKKLKIKEMAAEFGEMFAQKREEQKQLQMIDNKYQRSDMYKASDTELNEIYNDYLAGHYARYVAIYLLPVFLVMAWLNHVYSAAVLQERLGFPFVLSVPENSWKIEGVSVTLVFLISYILFLLCAFLFGRKKYL